MNEKQIRRAYARVNTIMNEFDAEKRAKMRVPLWRRACSVVGWEAPENRWREAWEVKHKRAMHAARKMVARAIVDEEKRRA